MPGAIQNGKTEYKSVTVAEDSTAEEFMDFYLDDDTRTTWVSTSAMLSLPHCCLHELACILVSAPVTGAGSGSKQQVRSSI